ncbi:MAG: ABC transporter substrate-binding protein [Nanoarchaeota archaeon]|nr:ABC transporter substrate-binding protein [Nanoarchaeota archaeon]
MKKFIAFMLIILLVLVVGCGQMTSQAVEEPVKIGVISAQTGGVSAISLPSKYAIEMALEDWNSNPGNMQKFEIIYEDNQGKALVSVTAFHKLVDYDQVAGVIGDITSTTMSIGPLADRTKTPVISYITTSPIARDAGDYVFRTSPMNLEGMRMTANYMIENGITEISILSELNDYPISLKDAFKEEYLRLGGKVLAEELFDASVADIRTEITKAKGKNPQAMMLFVISPRTGVNLLEQIKQLNIDVPLYGSENVGSDLALRIGGPAVLEDLIFSSPVYNKEKMDELKARYIEKVGEDQVLDWLYVATGYDAAMIYFETITEVGTDPEAIKDYLYNLKDYDGVSGKITFDSYGDPVGAEYQLFQFHDGEKVVIG